jgi:hypothetical protein
VPPLEAPPEKHADLRCWRAYRERSRRNDFNCSFPRLIESEHHLNLEQTFLNEGERGLRTKYTGAQE